MFSTVRRNVTDHLIYLIPDPLFLTLDAPDYSKESENENQKENVWNHALKCKNIKKINSKKTPAGIP